LEIRRLKRNEQSTLLLAALDEHAPPRR